MIKKYLKDYCVGCGLCEATRIAECKENENGFYYPETGNQTWLEQVCPAGGSQQKMMDFSNIWGASKAVCYGWSADSEVRTLASSGGILTEIASWLLESGKVDGIAHTCADPLDPTRTIPCVSTTRNELVNRSGSRYAISHPLTILSSLDKTKRYAFIGKPCDVSALRNFMEIEGEWKNIIPYVFSFFCAGLPSKSAQKNLLEHLKCPKDNVKSLRYRGDGWPGYTVAVEQSGEEHRTDYNTSWGHILGRDIMTMCRFCLDGVGEVADISCGDAWYLTPDRKPDFSESEGRNIIFARTEIGKTILDEMIAAGKIITETAIIDDLKYIQPYQNDRRATMIDKLVAMRIMARCVPKYKIEKIRNYSGAVSLRKHASVLKGTLVRIIKGRV